MSKCIVANCIINSNVLVPSPHCPKMLELWQKILNVRSKSFKICAEHFDSQPFQSKLKPDAFPTKFLANMSYQYCQSCMKAFVRTRFLSEEVERKYTIDKTFQSLFNEVMQHTLPNGVVCLECFEQVQKFHEFRVKIDKVRQTKLKIANEQLLKEKKRSSLRKNVKCLVFKEELAQIAKKSKNKPLTEPKSSSETDSSEEPIDNAEGSIKDELMEEQIINEGGSSFVISEVKSVFDTIAEPPRKQMKITGYGTVTPQVRIKESMKPINVANGHDIERFKIVPKPVAIIKEAPVKLSSLSNPLQQPRVITNPNGQIKITQHQLNIMQKESESLKCSYCPNFFVDAAFVNEHIKQKHTFVCIICHTIFPFKVTLIKHQQSAHGGSFFQLSGVTSIYKFPCVICKLKFLKEDARNEHIRKEHKVVLMNDEEVKEKETHKPVASVSKLLIKSDFKERLRSIKKRKAPISEDKDGIPCFLVFKPVDLPRHRIDIHDIERAKDKKYHQCDLCGFEAPYKSRLKMHLQTKHSVKRPFKCGLCPSAFSSQCELTSHQNARHLFIRYACEFCSMIFTNRLERLTHMKIHSNDE